MPRKKSAIPPATRIRENQRRSRTRRKELIEDLQRRLRAYEDKEVQATLAMQLAARRVAWENAQLRDLLASSGVSAEEIEGFLRSREPIAMRVPLNTFAGEETQSSIAAQVHEYRHIEALCVASPTVQSFRELWRQETGTPEQENNRSTGDVAGHVFVEAPGSELRGIVPRLRLPGQHRRCVDSVQIPSPAEDKCGCDTSDRPAAVDAEQNNTLPTVSDCFCPAPPTSNSFTGDDLMLEMSCETAASIISSMRGNGDREQARWQLGCEGREHCNVKNVKVLQVMDMD